MTLQQLNCFAHVARYRSFARAAELLFISQPAVSHHIRSLEADLGTQLVERSLHHVSLTAAGERFYIEVVDILDHLDSAVSMVRGGASLPETIHIGYESTIQVLHLADILREYRKSCPGVSVCSHEVSASNMNQLFREGKLDVVFATNRTVDALNAQFLTLFQGTFCCVMPIAHPLAARERIFMQDLQNETFILLDSQNCPPEMDALQREIRRRCANALLSFSASSLYTAPMIEAGLGIAVMPDFVIPPSSGIVKRPFEDDIHVEYGLIWHKNVRGTKIEQFIKAVKQAYAVQKN